MKTYKKTIVKPLLEIFCDEFAVSPRINHSNLGTFITIDRNINSPDTNKEFYEIISTTGNIATSLKNHIQLIKNEFVNIDQKIVFITPVCKYEHSNICYKIGNIKGFDYSNNGFYIVTEQNLKDYGIVKNDEKINSIIKDEINTYNKWCNGNIYGYELYNDKGEGVDSCWGFYSIEAIKEHLPEEWKNEKLEKYLISN